MILIVACIPQTRKLFASVLGSAAKSTFHRERTSSTAVELSTRDNGRLSRLSKSHTARRRGDNESEDIILDQERGGVPVEIHKTTDVEVSWSESGAIQKMQYKPF